MPRRIIALCLMVILAVWVMEQAHASKSHHHHEGTEGPQGPQGEPGADGFDGMDIGISDKDFAQGLSIGIAGAGMDFTSTTTKLQLGLSGSWYDGENGFAVGIAQVIDSEAMGDVLYSLKLMGCNGCSKTAGVVSAVWNIR